MSQEDGHGLLPVSGGEPLPSFEVVLRGYDRRQVEDAFDRLEGDLASLAADRDPASARWDASAAQAEGLHTEMAGLVGEIYHLRQQLECAVRNPHAEVSGRVQ